MPLDVDTLCNTYTNRETFDLALSDWERTHSAAAHFHRALNSHNYLARYEAMELPHSEMSGHATIGHGLPAAEADRICREAFSLDLARVSVQIADPKVTKIVKDVKISFYDQVGVLGTRCILLSNSIESLVSSLGGTVGLFTGASIISVAEAIFWVMKVRG